MNASDHIAVLGYGHLARALISGWQRVGLNSANLRILARSPEEARAQAPDAACISTQLEPVVDDADVIHLCVKPQDCAALCQQLPPLLAGRSPLVLSFCAGLRVKTLRAWLADHGAIIRAMPNLAVADNEGATALYADGSVTGKQRKRADQLISALGLSVWVDYEEQLDTVTALSGSGPAYFLLLLKSLIDAGVRHGLDEPVSRQLAAQTLIGSAHMLSANGSLQDLIDHVACRGGSTRKALDALTAAGFGTAIVEAVGAAAARCRELDESLAGDKDPAILSA